MLKKTLTLLIIMALACGGYALGYLGIGKDEVSTLIGDVSQTNESENPDENDGQPDSSNKEEGQTDDEQDKIQITSLDRSLVHLDKPISLLTGIFSMKENAEAHIQELSDYPLELIETIDAHDNNWYLVLLGEFNSVDDTWLLQNELNSQRQINPYLVNKPEPPAKQ